MPARTRPPMRPPKAPFPWYGGKQYLADTLTQLLPPHRVYVEVFGGAASLLFTKPASALEVYNDSDSDLVHFFRTLRDPAQTPALQHQLALTPYAREEWAECTRTWADDTADDIERARRYLVAITASFGKHLGSATGWSYSATPRHDKAHAFRSATAQRTTFTARLRYVQVEHHDFAPLDFASIIAAYDAPHTLFYCDPPDVPSTRTRNDRYHHEMTLADHERLVDLLTTVRGIVLLCGYRCALYDTALVQHHSWTRHDFPTHTWSASRRREQRIECVWMNPCMNPCMNPWMNPTARLAQPPLFADLPPTVATESR